MEKSDLLASAIMNNILWCDAMSRIHGSETKIIEKAWFSTGTEIPFYPKLITRTIETSTEEILTLVDRLTLDSGGKSFGIKDSFGNLRLDPKNFDLLFESFWIAKESRLFVSDESPSTLMWIAVDDSTVLEAWVQSWAECCGESVDIASSIFSNALLSVPNVKMLLAKSSEKIEGGAIVHEDNAVRGVSNVFCTSNDEELLWKSLVSHLNTAAVPLPVVGYENGSSLVAAEKAGFVKLEKLNIWIKKSKVD